MVRSLFLCLCLLLTLSAGPQALAINASPWPVEVAQPDGTPLKLKVHGNAAFHWFEDEKGFSVLQRGRDYVFAEKDAAGLLVPGKDLAGKAAPEKLGIAKGLRPHATQNARKFGGPALINADGGNPTLPELPPSNVVAPSGTVRNLVVMCRFSDHTLATHTRPIADYDTIFNAVGGDPTLAPTGSVRDFYTENSYGTMTLQSTVTTWVTLPQTEAYYANGTDGTGAYPQNAQKMVQDALALIDPTINFAQFDQDNDGFIDSISIIHSGYGAETGGGGGNWIWSHRWTLPANWSSADLNGSGVAVKVKDYHTEPALWGTSGTAPVRIAVICHETGHFFNLPDLYDTDNSSEGIGSYCLMANSWGFDFTQLHPPHFSAWCKAQLGWVTPTVIGPGDYTAPRVANTPTVFKCTAGFPSGEYLLIENRQPFGFESDIPLGGLAIWHIDENKVDNSTEGFPGQVGWPGNGNHYKVALLQADGQFHLEKANNRGDAGDLYRGGGVTTLNSTTVPDTKSYRSGVVTASGTVISAISAPGNDMTFNLSFDIAIPEIQVMGNKVIIADGDTTSSTTDFTNFGSTATTGGTVTRVFTIQNLGTGPLALTGTPRVAVSGTNAADFVVSVQPAASVAAVTGETTFSVVFDPGAGGTRTATLTIANNDANENPYNFSISGTGLLPEIAVSGNGVNIVDGDSTPATTDNTNFGSVLLGTAIVKTFVIANSGASSLNLTGNPKVVVGGAHAIDFVVTTMPTSPVALASNTSFQVTFTPSGGGMRDATLSFANDDSNENPFNFSIRGTGTGPEINLTGNAMSILDGDTTPAATDFTDFGNVPTAAGTLVRTFTIQNTGTAVLNLTGNPRVVVSGPQAADFTVTTLPAATVAAAGSTTFQVTFDPAGYGLRSATLSIDNDDTNENPYDLAIQGTGANAAPTDILLSSVSLAENNVAGVLVGNLSGVDPDPGNAAALVFLLVAGTGSTHNASFTLAGNELRLTPVANFEAQSSYAIRLRATDTSGLFFEKAFTIAVTNVNEAPTNILLSTSTIAENNAVGATVGTLSPTDPDAADTATFSLVVGLGAADNASFAIVGNSLRLSLSADFEAKNSFSIRLRVQDAGGLSFEKAFVVTVTNVNEAPSAIVLSSLAIPENNLPNATVVTLSATDPDFGDPHTFTLASGPNGNDNRSFIISGNELKLTTVANVATQASYRLRIGVTDTGGLSLEQTFVIQVTNANEAPTSIALSSLTISENNAANATVGSLSASDPDPGDTHTYALVAGVGDTDNSSFAINGNELKLAPSTDFETQSSYHVRIRVTDTGGLFAEQAFVIQITNANEAPTSIALSNLTISENNAANATVGSLSVTDHDAGDTHTFMLVTGAGDTDNSSFTITGNELKLNRSADFESKASYHVRVRATDAGGLFVEQAFVIQITNANEAPASLALSNLTISENTPPNATVGSLSVTDPDAGDSHTFVLVTGAGDTDNSSFTIAGNELKLNLSADFETKASYQVRVRATDAGGLFVEQAFVIQITNANEAPTSIALSNLTISENNAAIATVGSLSVTDHDAGDTHTFTLANGAGDMDNTSFTISENELKLTPSTDFETQTSYHVRVRATDAGGLFLEQSFVIQITNANEAPTSIVLSNLTISENNAANAVVGGLSATDPDARDTHTFVLAAGAGDTDNSSFTITGNELKLTPSADFETKASYHVRVRGTDAGGLFSEQAFVFQITNANEAPTSIALSNLTISENNAANATVGSLSAIDPDAGDTHTFVLAAGAGDTDNSSFAINGNELKLTPSADFETKESYQVRVRATDAGGLFVEQAFVIQIMDMVENRAPIFTGCVLRACRDTLAVLPSQVVFDNASDADGDVLTIASAGPVGNHGGTASLGSSGTTIHYTPALGFLGNETISIVITDGHGGTVQGLVTAYVGRADPLVPMEAQMTTIADGSVALIFQMAPNQPCCFQRSNDLGSWTELLRVKADSRGLVSGTDPTSGQRAYYRVVPEAP